MIDYNMVMVALFLTHFVLVLNVSFVEPYELLFARAGLDSKVKTENKQEAKC